MKWALILGVSSGFGAETARSFARRGYGIFGVHLDRRGAMAAVDLLREELGGFGVPVHFHNGNAASDSERESALDKLGELLSPTDSSVDMLLHSLAFGTLRPYLGEEARIGKRHLDMTLDVMAHSLVYWVQGLVERELLREGGRIFAMTSSGSLAVWPSYGAVSAAKCALESHIRQLALEMAPLGITANAIMAGVTQTPALSKIPGADEIAQRALERNPHRRLTQPSDISEFLVTLCDPSTAWLTGNVLRVDGGETIAS